VASGLGRLVQVPRVVFAFDEVVIPDLVWISNRRYAHALDTARHLTIGTELVIEVFSPGAKNEQRGREFKLKLYSRRGVDEYWIADWMHRLVEVYRQAEGALKLVTTLHEGDVLTSPLLPGVSGPVADLFADMSEDAGE
jgi:Uma2 family endonuclease